MIEIIDYDITYAKQVNYLDQNYWGGNEEEDPSKEIEKNDIVKLAVINNEVIGILHFKIIGNLIDLHQILVEQSYQNQGIGTDLLQSALDETDKLYIDNIVAHAVEFDGKINSEKLLKKFGFKEIYRVQNYWNALYPGYYCKQCKDNHCHCGVVVFIKQIS